MRKLYALALPVLAVAAFTIAPSSALAITSYGTCGTVGAHSANCPGTEHFTEFPGEARVGVNGKKVSAEFILENEAKTVDIDCNVIDFVGKFWNVAGVGHSHLILVFEGCKGSGGLATTCGGANIPNGNGIIEGVVTDEVTAVEKVTVTIESGFGVKCGATNLGAVTGTATGTQTNASAVLKFKEAKGLTFAGEKSQISGEVEFLTIEGGKKVYI